MTTTTTAKGTVKGTARGTVPGAAAVRRLTDFVQPFTSA
jgi:hypothetical protein